MKKINIFLRMNKEESESYEIKLGTSKVETERKIQIVQVRLKKYRLLQSNYLISLQNMRYPVNLLFLIYNIILYLHYLINPLSVNMQNISLQKVNVHSHDHQFLQNRQINKISQTLALPKIKKSSCLHKRNFVRHWSFKEKLKFALFLDYYGSSLNYKSSKKSLRIFKIMSDFIKTRDQNQCRSHYHKTLKLYKTNQKIIQSAKKTFKNYEQEKIKMFSQFQKSQSSSQKSETNVSSEKNEIQFKIEKHPNCHQWELGSLKYINELRQKIEQQDSQKLTKNILAKNRNSQNSEQNNKFNWNWSQKMNMINQITQLQFYYSKWIEKMKELAELDPKLKGQIYHYLEYGV